MLQVAEGWVEIALYPGSWWAHQEPGYEARVGTGTNLLMYGLAPRPSPSLLQVTGSWVMACTASDGKLGEGLYCKGWEAG